MNTGIKQVAQAAGVSIATVSRVMNNTGPVREETRRRVLAAVREYHYLANTNARSLKIADSKSIALLINGMTSAFFSPMVQIIEKKAALRGHMLLMETVAGGSNELVVAQRVLAEKKPKGIIFLGGTFVHDTEEFLALGGTPCVMLTVTTDNPEAQELFSSVIVGEEAAARTAVDYLLSLGHRQIAFLAEKPFDPATTGYHRMQGYRNALEAHGIPFDASLVRDCAYTPAAGYAAVLPMVRQHRVTAVFAASDTVAMGAAKAALVAGLDIPKDFSVIGFDGIEMAEYYHPSLDTMAQPGAEMAAASVTLLFERMEGKPNRHLVFEASLTRRGSCGPAPL